MKKCSKCKEFLNETEFTKDKMQRSGLNCRCKRCRRAGISAEWTKAYREKTKETRKTYMAEYRLKNLAKLRAYTRKNYFEKRKQMLQYAKEYREKNRETISNNMKEYGQKNKRALREKANERRRIKIKTDPKFKILHNLRRRMGLILEGKRKAETTKKLIGCDLETIKRHLEQKFDENMSWDNYGSYWEVDHIIPCKEFDLSLAEEQKKCFHYTNLQPLAASENRSKGAKIIQYGETG